MYDRILVPLDGSQPATEALRVGKQLAERFEAVLEVLGLTDGSKMVDLPSLIQKQVDRAGASAAVCVRNVSYGVAEDIASEFDTTPRTLLVMQTWARGRTAGIIGNVSEEVLRLTRKPMVALGSEPQLKPGWLDGPIFIATDGSHFGDTIAPIALEFATALSIEPQLITVNDPSAVPGGIDPKHEANSLIRLANSIRSDMGVSVNYDVLHGSNPADAITAHAEQRGASFVAMSTHGRSGLDRITHDSVAMDVVRHGRYPVLLCRPPFEQD